MQRVDRFATSQGRGWPQARSLKQAPRHLSVRVVSVRSSRPLGRIVSSSDGPLGRRRSASTNCPSFDQPSLIADLSRTAQPSHPLTDSGRATLERVLSCGRDRLTELAAGWQPDQHPQLGELINSLAGELLETRPLPVAA